MFSWTITAIEKKNKEKSPLMKVAVIGNNQHCAIVLHPIAHRNKDKKKGIVVYF